MQLKTSRFLLFLFSLFTLLSVYYLKDQRFEFSIEKFFPEDDAELAYFRSFQETYHSHIDEEFIFIGLRNKKGIFDGEFLKKADELTKYLESQKHILSVYSLTNARYFSLKNKALKQEAVLKLDSINKLKEDSARLESYPEYKSFYLSNDGKTLAISAFNAINLAEADKENLMAGIRDKIDELNFDEFHLLGKIFIEKTYVSEIRKNLVFYLIVSLLLISLSLKIIFKSWKIVAFTLVIIAASVAGTMGMMAFADVPLDVISILLPPVLAVICMSDIIHIISKYTEEVRSGLSQKEAIISTYNDIGLATFYTSLTTAAGFFSLCITGVVPIRMFGLFAGLGVLYAFLLTLAFLFAVFHSGILTVHVAKSGGNEKWNKSLHATFGRVLKYRKFIVLFFTMVVLISLPFMLGLEINSSLLQEIPKNHAIRKEINFFENEFAGSRPFELGLKLKDSTATVLNYTNLKTTEKIEQYLKDSCSVDLLISPLSFIKSANRAYMGGDESQYKIPESDRAISFFANKVVMTKWGSELMRYVPVTSNQARISGKLPDLSLVEFSALEKQFDKFFKREKLDEVMDYKFTGSAIQLDRIAGQLAWNVISGLLLAFVLISLITASYFRSAGMILVVLVVNIIPLLITAAVMSALGIYLKADTSVIFAIAFGISVDDSIHFIIKLKLELKRGRNILYALKRTYLTTGKAIIYTSIVLIMGFFTLMFSSFGGTFYIGLLISLCLVTSLITDLTLLPLMVLGLHKLKYRIH